MGAWALLVWGTAGISAAQAQATGITPQLNLATQTTAPGPLPPETTPIAAPARLLQYTLGLRIKTLHAPDASAHLVLRPVLGLRYGRWRLGHATGETWLQFSGYRKDASLSYQLRENARWRLALSMRVQNLKDNTSFDGFSDGQNTLRGRLGVSYQLNQRWSIGSDFTQDLLGRGDGSTASLGASYGLPLNAHSVLSLSGGLSWASATHWASQMRLLATPAQGWQSGLGALGLGVAYRYAITPQWAWFGAVGSSQPLGQVKDISTEGLRWNGQLGILYFSR